MDFVKKHLVSLIAGVVALMALVAIYIWPLDKYYEELKVKTEERAGKYGQIGGLMGKSRGIPVFELDNPEGSQMRDFPTVPVIKLGQSALEKIRTEAENIYKEAVKINFDKDRRALFLRRKPKAQYEAASPSEALSLRPSIEQGLRDLREKTLVAGIPPTPEEIKKRADIIWKDYEKKIILDLAGQPINQASVDAAYNQELARLPEVMKKEMATKYKMYVNPTAVMTVPGYIPTRDVPDPSIIWWAHVEYWITQDVVDAIARINGPAKTVLEAPVKQLNALSVPTNFYPAVSTPAGGTGREMGGMRGGGEDQPAAPTAGPPNPEETIPTSVESPTLRISNNLYDVCRFTLSVDIEAQRVPQFIRMLTSRRFLTVLKFDMTAIDSQLKQLEGYVYGSRPVVKLDLECEVLLLRQWTMPFMPPDLKKQLGLENPGTGGGAARPIGD